MDEWISKVTVLDWITIRVGCVVFEYKTIKCYSQWFWWPNPSNVCKVSQVTKMSSNFFLLSVIAIT